MHLTMIQFKLYGAPDFTDICVVRNDGIAKKYALQLQEKYPSYKCGEFAFKKVKYVKHLMEREC